MGNATSANDEWVELYNDGTESVSLEGWSFSASDGSPSVTLSGTISGGGYFMLERTDDDSEPTGLANAIFTGSLSNSGEILLLKNAQGTTIDTVDGSNNWAIGGNNETKETLQRSGSGWKTANASPRSGAGGSAGGSGGESQNTHNTSSAQKVSYAPIDAPIYALEPTIKVEVGNNMTVTAGSVVELEGVAWGEKGEKLESDEVRWRWNFGDGAVQHGKKVTHTFAYPGAYAVELSVINEAMFESVSDRLVVTARPALVTITGTNAQFIEIKNNDTVEIALGHWLLTDGSSFFSIPEGTYILPGITVRFSSEYTKLKGGARTALLYPNTKVATSFNNASEASNDTTPFFSSTVTQRVATTQSSQPVRIVAPSPITVKENAIEKAVEGGVQSASVLEAIDTEASVAATIVAKDESLFKWLIALFGLIGIGIAGVYMSGSHRDHDEDVSSSVLTKDEADEYTIVT